MDYEVRLKLTHFLYHEQWTNIYDDIAKIKKKLEKNLFKAYGALIYKFLDPRVAGDLYNC